MKKHPDNADIYVVHKWVFRGVIAMFAVSLIDTAIIVYIALTN